MKYFLLIIFLSIGCSSPEIDPTIKLENELIGNWEWLKTYSKGDSGSPSIDGYTKRINFLGNKLVEIYINDTLKNTQTIHWYYPSVSQEVLHITIDPEIYGPVIFKGDSLVLDNSFFDGPIFIYRRL